MLHYEARNPGTVSITFGAAGSSDTKRAVVTTL